MLRIVTGLVGFNRKQVAEDCPLLRAVLGLKPRGLERILALLRGHLAQVAESIAKRVPAFLGHLSQSLGCAADFLLTLRRKRHKALIALHHAPAYLRRLSIEPVQSVDESLLLVGRQVGKAGLVS